MVLTAIAAPWFHFQWLPSLTMMSIFRHIAFSFFGIMIKYILRSKEDSGNILHLFVKELCQLT